MMFQIVSQAQLSRPKMQNSYSEPASINQTFQILKIVGEMEKGLKKLQALLQNVAATSKSSEIQQIKRMLYAYLKQESVGAKIEQSMVRTQMLLSWKYLQLPPTPFLPSMRSIYKYTIVLDLDKTLIFYNRQTNALKYRPFLDTFLKKLKSFQFQIIIFSSESKQYTDAIVQQIQRKQSIFEYRLYKQHLTIHKGRLVKDLGRLQRNLSKVIIMDDKKSNFACCIDNAIEVSPWTGNKDDRQLLYILSILSNILNKNGQDSDIDFRKLIKYNRKNLRQMLLQGSQAGNNIEIDSI